MDPEETQEQPTAEEVTVEPEAEPVAEETPEEPAVEEAPAEEPVAEEATPVITEEAPAGVCADCNGEGLKSQTEVCPTCKGTGKV